MSESLAGQFRKIFSSFSGKKAFTEDNVSEAVRSIRMALLDADVSYSVASAFVQRVKKQALGKEILKSIDAKQLFTKIVHEELVELLSSENADCIDQGTILLCGLQGVGKTTTAAKLAAYLSKKKKKNKTLLATCDFHRLAAWEQLQALAKDLPVDVFPKVEGKSPVEAVSLIKEHATNQGYDLLILDSAGRTHLDTELMKELQHIAQIIKPQETLLVLNAGMGQEAVNTAEGFDHVLNVTGFVLTMMEGSARAGCALSIKSVTKKPIKFEGVGESIEDFQPCNPVSVADRILGMGDVINLVRKVQEQTSEEEQEELKKKVKDASFTYEDYLKQMRKLKKMGSFTKLLGMLPGMSSMQLGDFDASEKRLVEIESMILSMTPGERGEKVELIPSRKKRIARGSGVSIESVQKMIKQFQKVKKICKILPKDLGNMQDMMSHFGKILGGKNLWQ